ncbi:hypothetical protein SCOR_29280 [Sulfidibacter corallicola]|uniref:Uncharacterized protein n=1 Tax=Sulfidibacter corallicola TaxID=2818388 RepID=A0A8A4TN78_SULCO|nr:hypothetical protein [Sulfidibacter corallicola]QTD50351.1 hypothetical protein J3U87_32605 [Sulfidibacter corallicola]
MDRFYLEKLVEDLNHSVAGELERVLDTHLTYCWPMDRSVEIGEAHFKVLRFLIAIGDACPAARLLEVHGALAALTERFSGQDYRCHIHIGHDDWVPASEDIYQVVLQIMFLDDGKNHLTNKLQAAKILEDPEQQERELPPWLAYDEHLSWDHVEDEVLTFCQYFVSSEFRNLNQIRNFETAFWRVVNLACGYFSLETYEDLVARMPERFRPALGVIPLEWQELRQKETEFDRPEWERCSRSSIRFCQHLLEMGR